MAINNPFGNLGRFFTRPAPVDLSGLFQAQPYPVHPMVTILGALGATMQAREFQRQQEEERAFQQSQRQATLEEQKRQAAERKVQGYLSLVGGDPQRAYLSGGQDFLTAWEAAGRGKLTTRPQTAQIAQPRQEEGSLGRFLQPRGTQTIQTPGTELNIPAPPAAPPKKQAFFNTRTGQIQLVELPADTSVTTYTPPGQPTRHVIVDSHGRIVAELPPGVVPHTLPKQGGEGGIPAPAGAQSVFGDWEVLPPRTKAGESQYRNRRTGQVLSRAGAMQVLQNTGDQNLASALGVPVPTRREPTENVDGRPMTLAQIEDEMRLVGSELRRIGPRDPKNYPAVSVRLQQLTQARTRLLSRGARSIPASPAQPATAGPAPDPLGIR